MTLFTTASHGLASHAEDTSPFLAGCWCCWCCSTMVTLRATKSLRGLDARTRKKRRRTAQVAAAAAVLILLLLTVVVVCNTILSVNVSKMLLQVDNQDLSNLPLTLPSLSNSSNINSNGDSTTLLRYSKWLGCLTDDCIQQIASRIGRAFPPRDDKSSWCRSSSQVRDDHRTRTTTSAITSTAAATTPYYTGLLLTKVPKGASSTCAGVALRIAHRHQCAAVHWQHRLGHEYAASRSLSGSNSSSNINSNINIKSKTSFLWTSVRNPAHRALSTLFFHVVSRTPQRTTATSDSFLLHQLGNSTHLHYGTVAPETAGFQLRYTLLHHHNSYSNNNDNNTMLTPSWRPEQPTTVQNPARIVEWVQSIIDDYDFILVPERMDESLVALAFTLGLADVGDVLVAASKVSATAAFHLVHASRSTYQCVPVVPSFVSPAVRAYFDSDEWRALNYGDYLLHAAAHQALDRTIQQYNNDNNNDRAAFDRALQRFRALRAMERDQCPAPDLPCSSTGAPQVELAARNCYLKHYDFGCGYPCVDALLKREHHHHNNNDNVTDTTTL